MNALPATSPEHYLTGTSAMAIPSPETSFVNWHFVDTFISGRADFRLAGINFPDTSALLGASGVRECGETLRRLGAHLPPMQTFYAANRDRAFLDMLLGNLQRGRRPDHLRIMDCCDGESEAQSLHDQIDSLRSRLSDSAQLRHLEAWLAEQ